MGNAKSKSKDSNDNRPGVHTESQTTTKDKKLFSTKFSSSSSKKKPKASSSATEVIADRILERDAFLISFKHFIKLFISTHRHAVSSASYGNGEPTKGFKKYPTVYTTIRSQQPLLNNPSSFQNDADWTKQSERSSASSFKSETRQLQKYHGRSIETPSVTLATHAAPLNKFDPSIYTIFGTDNYCRRRSATISNSCGMKNATMKDCRCCIQGPGDQHSDGEKPCLPSFFIFEEYCTIFNELHLKTLTSLENAGKLLPGYVSIPVFLESILGTEQDLMACSINFCKYFGDHVIFLENSSDIYVLAFEELWFLYWYLSFPMTFVFLEQSFRKEFDTYPLRNSWLAYPDMSFFQILFILYAEDSCAKEKKDVRMTLPAFKNFYHCHLSKYFPHELESAIFESIFAFSLENERLTIRFEQVPSELQSPSSKTNDWWLKEAAELQKKMDKLLLENSLNSSPTVRGRVSFSSHPKTDDIGFRRKNSPVPFLPLSWTKTAPPYFGALKASDTLITASTTYPEDMEDSFFGKSQASSSASNRNFLLDNFQSPVVKAPTIILSEPSPMPSENGFSLLASKQDLVITFECLVKWLQRFFPFLSSDMESSLTLRLIDSSKAKNEEDRKINFFANEKKEKSPFSVTLTRQMWLFLNRIFLPSWISPLLESSRVISIFEEFPDNLKLFSKNTVGTFQPPLVFSPKFDGFSITQLRYLCGHFTNELPTLVYIEASLSQGSCDKLKETFYFPTEVNLLKIAVYCPPGAWYPMSSRNIGFSGMQQAFDSRFQIFVLMPFLDRLFSGKEETRDSLEISDKFLSKRLRTQTISSGMNYHQYLSPFDPFKTSFSDKNGQLVGDLYFDNRYGLGFIERLDSNLVSFSSHSIQSKLPTDTSFVLFVDPYFNQGTFLSSQYGLLAFEVLDFEVYGLPLSGCADAASDQFPEFNQWLESFYDLNNLYHDRSFILKRKSLEFS